MFWRWRRRMRGEHPFVPTLPLWVATGCTLLIFHHPAALVVRFVFNPGVLPASNCFCCCTTPARLLQVCGQRFHRPKVSNVLLAAS